MTLLLICSLALWPPGFGEAGAADYPRPEEFARRVRQALQLDYEIQQNFTYRERRRDVKISKLGKVTIGPLRTFEVYPSDQPGRTYKRLIEVDGVPLTAAELARRDAQRESDLQREAGRDRASPAKRAEPAAEIEEDRRHRRAILDDVVTVFVPTFVGRETIDDQRILVADLRPRPDARPATREGRWMKQFAGRIWVDESDYQVVKLDMHAEDDVTIGWGIIGRLHKGSRLLFLRRRFSNAWLPAEVTYEASGRTLLFRPFRFAVTTTYSDYRRR